jgi:hypothetical protein
MKKIISMISAVLVMFAFSSPITSIAKSAEFFTIGTGGRERQCDSFRRDH